MEHERDAAVIPYFAHEGMVDRLDRVNRRLLVALIIAVVLLFGSNAYWLHCWMQYDYVDEGTQTEIVTTVDSEGEGIANYTGNNGGVTIGKSYSTQDDNDTDTNPDAPDGQ